MTSKYIDIDNGKTYCLACLDEVREQIQGTIVVYNKPCVCDGCGVRS